MMIPVLFAIFKLIIIFFTVSKRFFDVNEGNRILNAASSKKFIEKGRIRRGKYFNWRNIYLLKKGKEDGIERK